MLSLKAEREETTQEEENNARLPFNQNRKDNILFRKNETFDQLIKGEYFEDERPRGDELLQRIKDVKKNQKEQ